MSGMQTETVVIVNALIACATNVNTSTGIALEVSDSVSENVSKESQTMEGASEKIDSVLLHQNLLHSG